MQYTVHSTSPGAHTPLVALVEQPRDDTIVLGVLQDKELEHTPYSRIEHSEQSSAERIARISPVCVPKPVARCFCKVETLHD